MEDLKGIKSRVLGSLEISTESCRSGTPGYFSPCSNTSSVATGTARYVDPRNSSKTCPLCQATVAAYGGRLMKCDRCGLMMDKDVIAVLNLRMWGFGVTPKGDELLRVIRRG